MLQDHRLVRLHAQAPSCPLATACEGCVSYVDVLQLLES